MLKMNKELALISKFSQLISHKYMAVSQENWYVNTEEKR